MTLRHWITGLAVVAVTAAPALAQDNNRHRRDNRQPQQQQQQQQSQQAEQPRREQPQQQQAAPPQRQNERAVPRNVEPQREQQRREYRDNQVRRDDNQVRRQDNQIRREDVQRRNDQIWGGVQQRRNDEQVRRDVAVPRAYSNNRVYGGRNDVRRWDGGRYGEPLRYRYGYGYGYAPRIIRPTIIQIAPYRPYVYRPSWSIGVYYGYDDYYPYGYTPEGYYNPLPGHYYGGVRITGAPRDARVFADGYFVGIVDDFDGIFQHINLEAGPHHIEIQWGAIEPVAFDVNVRPGQTITFRADPSMFGY